MILSKRIRLKPNKVQEHKLLQSVGTSRYIYNWTLEAQYENYKLGNKFISNYDLRKKITFLKKSELSWLNEVSNNVAKQAVKDACNAYKNFFKKRAEKPRFKNKKNESSFYNDPSKLKFNGNLVLIEKVGWIRCNKKIMNQKFYNPRVSFDGKYWYLSVGIEQTKEKEKLNNLSLGITLGIKDTAILSTGKTYKNINETINIKKANKKLKKLKKQVSRKYKINNNIMPYHKTKNIVKLEKKIRLLHRRISNIRLNYNHEITTEIVRAKPSQIVIEDLDIRRMMKNKHLYEKLEEQSLYQLTKLLTYKCELHGIKLIKSDKYFPPSKVCSKCGSIKKDLKISDRVYKCNECGSEIDKDLNAAINLSHYKCS